MLTKPRLSELLMILSQSIYGYANVIRNMNLENIRRNNKYDILISCHCNIIDECVGYQKFKHVLYKHYYFVFPTNVHRKTILFVHIAGDVLQVVTSFICVCILSQRPKTIYVKNFSSYGFTQIQMKTNRAKQNLCQNF